MPDSVSDPTRATAAPHPHGSLVEQVHRVITTDQGVDAWVLAEEIAKVIGERIAKRIERELPAMGPISWHDAVVYAAAIARSEVRQ